MDLPLGLSNPFNPATREAVRPVELDSFVASLVFHIKFPVLKPILC